jgi:hypothetical protein
LVAVLGAALIVIILEGEVAIAQWVAADKKHKDLVL